MPNSSYQLLIDNIDRCMLNDQFSLRKKLRSLQGRLKANKPSDKFQAELEQAIARSQQLRERRQQAVPEVTYPDLPIADKRDDIKKAISEHQVIVIAGETGSGKTTQLPKICLELGRGVKGLIGHTQPRRLAARTVAQRIADELKTPLGEGVGFQIRFSDQSSDTSHIKLMTDGILLAEIQKDKFLNRYDTIIIDEAHERSLNIDFLLGYLKQLLPKRPDLKLIITSATIDLESFSKHFDDAPVIEVSGRTYPVETLYRPLNDLNEDGDLAMAIEAAIDELMATERSAKNSQSGDVLVFLSGEGEIREVAEHLRKSDWPHCEVLPLYARLSSAEQNKVFDQKRRAGRRIILATNVAETSLTVPGIRYVIDPGYARISRYSYRTKVQRLPIEAISQASANQRKGRCGRVAEGICVRLYEEDDFNNRSEFTDPEIQRTNLASVILQMLGMRMGDVNDFPFVDPPDHRMISDGFKLLEELGAVDSKRELSEIGKVLTRFPVDPRLARMMMAANSQGCLSEILVIVSALSIQDPRERPADKRQASDEKHRRFWDKDSDFMGFLNLWNYYEEQRQTLKQNPLRKLCKREFLSFMRMREWRDIHRQLSLSCKELGFKPNKEPADFEAIHRALLAGLLSHVAMLDDEREYIGARNRKLRIFPGSSLSKSRGTTKNKDTGQNKETGQKKSTSAKWIMAAEIAETSQVYARTCARIQPEWLLGINDALFKLSYSEPHWQQRTGRVMAFERMSLYGLVISDRKSIHYGPIDAKVSRELLIKGGLVEGKLPKHSPSFKAPFFKHNQQLVTEVEALEAKSRRHDILVDDQQLFAFYDERIASEVVTIKHFDRWRKIAEQKNTQCLFIEKSFLMRHDADDVNEAQFPSNIQCGDLHFATHYHFEPGHPADGVTVTIPVGLLNRVPRHRFEWLVPGLLRDKCIALIKMLPKPLRKQMVPVPDYVDKVLAKITADDVPLIDILSSELKKISGITIESDQWQPDQLEDFYRMNYRVLDEKGKSLGQGRNLEKILSNFKGHVSETLQQQTQQRFTTDNITQWNFGELAVDHKFTQAGVTITSYPALVDCKDSVAIELKDFYEEAERESQRGLVRLYMLQLPQQLKYLRKDLLRGNKLNLQLAGISQQRTEWLDDLLYAVFYRVFIDGNETVRTEEGFQQSLATGKSQLVEQATTTSALLTKIADLYHQVRKQLKSANELAWVMTIADINQQLTLLFKPGFIADTPYDDLQQYPRYLEAISRRIEKLRGNFIRDKQLQIGLTDLSEILQQEWKSNFDAAIRSELLVDYRWMLEEYRVSLFAQQLGTKRPVSEKRLRECLKQVKKSLVSKTA